MNRYIALYLPQYHPFPENDEWWGKGFTEWTNVAKAKPLFRGHYQPHIPADLGFYDLRLPIIREQQAEMAKEAGIEGFCYWEYWFGGKGRQLIEKPFQEVVASGKPDFPFCLGWANESWTNKSWHAKSSMVTSRVLMEQRYSHDDYIEHFYNVLPAFKDKRYMTVDGKPIYFVFKPFSIPDARDFIDCWQKLAKENGLKGVYFVGIVHNISYVNIKTGKHEVPNFNMAGSLYQQALDLGFDAVNSRGMGRAEAILQGNIKLLGKMAIEKYLKINLLKKYDYGKITEKLFVPEDSWENVFPTVFPNWDRSPRSGKKAIIYTNSTPDGFKKQLELANDVVKNKADQHRIVVVQSWNEWGEGNHLEPDLKFGKGYLDAIKEMQSK